MTNADRRIILSCFANGFEFRKGMEQAKMAEVKTLDGVEIFTVDYMNRLAEMLCNALEKQVPKKPRSDHKYTSEVGKIGYDHCGACGTMVTRKYCPECGQRVDWTKEEV